MKSSVLLIIASFAFALSALAQDDNQTAIELLISEIFEQYAEESEQEIDFESFYEDLISVSQNPVNLNNATREQLSNLPFLSENQIENILAFRYLYGEICTIYELQLIDGLDMTDITRMLPFVRVGKSGENEQNKIYFREIFAYGKNELLTRLHQTLETREGYKNSENQSNNYQGEPFYHSLKYKFDFRNRILAGFQAEKDAGEPFFNQYGRGYDFVSLSAQINRFGIFKTVVVGDFRANFGMGLVLRQSFSMGKSAYVTATVPRGTGLKRYTSTTEYNFFRGAGATVALKNWEITAFGSLRKLDADTVGGVVSTFDQTGYHRIDSEKAKKNTVNQRVVGGDATFTAQQFRIGVTAVGTFLDIPVVPRQSPSTVFAFEGKNQADFSLHYRAVWQKFNFVGETASNQNLALATINTLSFSPISTADFVILYRNFSPHYNAFFSNAFSESSRVQNENGLYFGTEIHPYRRWKVSAYADSYRFPVARYGTDLPSYGTDYLLQTDFHYSRKINMLWRFRYKNNFKNYADNSQKIRQIAANKRWQMRYALNVLTGNFRLKTQLDCNFAQTAQNAVTYGISALQDVDYAFTFVPLKLNFRFQFFDARNYENRIYVYEKDVLYAFSIPMVYGLGSRTYLNLSWQISDHFAAWLKLAQTVYADDRTSIGSGRDRIEGNRRTDLNFQLRWKF